MSRRRLPDEVKRRRGTLRADRAATVRPEPGAIEAPAWLSPAAQRWHAQLVEQLRALGLEAPAFGPIVALAAATLGEIQELEELLQVAGRCYESSTAHGSVVWKARPEVAQLAQAKARLRQELAELGLTPASLGKVSKPPAPAVAPAFDWGPPLDFKRGRR
jgi:P27 family predicted phage terminase small subunit